MSDDLIWSLRPKQYEPSKRPEAEIHGPALSAYETIQRKEPLKGGTTCQPDQTDYWYWGA